MGKRSGTGPRSGKVDPVGKTGCQLKGGDPRVACDGPSALPVPSVGASFLLFSKTVDSVRATVVVTGAESGKMYIDDG